MIFLKRKNSEEKKNRLQINKLVIVRVTFQKYFYHLEVFWFSLDENTSKVL